MLGRNSQRPTNDGVKSPKRKTIIGPPCYNDTTCWKHTLLFLSLPLLSLSHPRAPHFAFFRQQPTCNRSASCSLLSIVSPASLVHAPKSRLTVNTKCTATVKVFTKFLFGVSYLHKSHTLHTTQQVDVSAIVAAAGRLKKIASNAQLLKQSNQPSRSTALL